MKGLNAVKAALKTAAIVVLLAALSACPMLGTSLLDDDPIDYFSKIVEYSRYVDPFAYYLEPVETRVHNDQGKLEGVFRHFYEPFAPGSEYWVLTRTEVFSVSEAGAESLTEYYEYTYVEDSYTEYDEDDLPYTVTVHLLERGETYGPDGFLRHYYEVTYQDMPFEPDRYTLITDYSYDGVADGYLETARQTSTYRVVYPPGIDPETDPETARYYDYVTEKYFVTPPDETGLTLSQEFASWYDDEGLWTHELYHTVRSSNGSEDDLYYYTKYEWNEAYQVYKQQDFLYDPAGIPVLAGQPEAFLDGTFDDDPDSGMQSHELDFAAVGALHESLTLSYDDVGNVIMEVRSYHGTEHERVRYRYNHNSEQLSMARYVHGQSYAYERVETRYRDEYRNGVYYRVREELTYKSYDPATAASIRSGKARPSPLTTLSHQAYRPLRSNHDR